MHAGSKIAVVAFGQAAAELQWTHREFDLPPGSTLQSFVTLLAGDLPSAGQPASRLRFAVNRKYAPLDQPLHDGDELAIIPPVAGG